MNNIIESHRLMVSASNAHRLMTHLDQDALPGGARTYISDMHNLPTDEFIERYVSRAMQWGIDNEPKAIAALEELFETTIENTGENQERLFAGDDYYNFVSALPDGVMMLDDIICTVEVKCLDTDNHQFAFDFILNTDTLKQYDFEKYCQCQVQNLCAEAYYCQPVKSIIVFYDPRHTTPLHYVEVDVDYEWRAKFKERVMLAKALYDDIANDDPNAPVLHDAPIPPAKVVNQSQDMVITTDVIDELLGNPAGFMQLAYDFFNVRIVNNHFVGGDLHFDCSTKKGRDEAIKYRTKVKKVRTKAIEISKKLVDAYNAKVKQERDFRKHIETGLKELEAYLCQSINDWEAEQDRIEQEAIEAKRREDELILAREAARVDAIKNKIAQLNTTKYIVDFDIDGAKAEIERISSIAIDELYQEFQDDAIAVKTESLRQLNARIELLTAQITEKHKNNYERLVSRYNGYDSEQWSVTGLKQKIAEAEAFTPFVNDYGDCVAGAAVATSNIIEKLKTVLIPAAEAREQALAEQRAAEIIEHQKSQVVDVVVQHSDSITPVVSLTHDDFVLINALLRNGLKQSKIYRDAIAFLNTQSLDGVGGYRIAAKLVENKGEIAAMLNEMTTEQKVIMKPILKQIQDNL